LINEKRFALASSSPPQQDWELFCAACVFALRYFSKVFFIRLLLEVLEKVNGISGNEATNGTSRDGEYHSHANQDG
jgi:hypothetical protein